MAQKQTAAARAATVRKAAVAAAPAAPSPVHPVLQLQAKIGNRATRHLIQRLSDGQAAAAKDRWAVDEETWKGRRKGPDGEYTESEEEFMARQLNEIDPAVMFQTMFADPKGSDKSMSASARQKLEASAEMTLAKQKFMRRLHLTMALGGVDMSTRNNPDLSKPEGLVTEYPWPLASVLGHGQRQLFEIQEKKGLGEAFYDYLGRGPSQDGRDVLDKSAWRGFASHATKVGERRADGTRRVEELKLPFHAQMGLRRHRGVNVPLGGIGNRNVKGDIIGPGGHPIDPATGEYLRKRQLVAIPRKNQHGHIYMNKHVRGDTMALMVGLEGSAPLTANMYGTAHTASSGAEDQTTKLSATGGQKASKLFGAKAPAEYGGKRTVVDEELLTSVKMLERLLDSLPREQQESFFKEILVLPPKEAKKKAIELVRRERY